MRTWFADPFRPTRDLDLLGLGDPDPESILDVFHEICAVGVDDGVTFDVNGLEVDRIREVLDYGGLRLKTPRQWPAPESGSSSISALATPPSRG
jgi:hypothetical protein